MKRNITLFIAVAATLAIALIAAGCGSAYSSGAYGSAAKPSRESNRRRGEDRRREVDAGSNRRRRKRPHALPFEKDKNRRSACSGSCATFWPPLLAHGKPVARPGVKQSLLGTTRRANGSQQVVYGGHPLYRFSLDRKAGQTKGEGLQDFGAGWEAVSPAGRKVETDG